MKKLSLILLLLAALPKFSLGQGYVFDTQLGFPKSPNDNSKGTEIEKKVSLLPYVPSIITQGKNDYSCTYIAAAYYAIGIQRAILHGVSNDPQQIQDRFCLSPMYLLARNNPSKKDCPEGINLQTIGRLMENSGSVPFVVLNATLCNDSRLQQVINIKSQPITVRKSETVFDTASSLNEKIIKVKQSLMAKRPVVVGLPLFESFKKITADNPYYIPEGKSSTKTLDDGREVALGHAVTVVEYNDSTGLFTMVNSEGENFGRKGYFYMSYSDFKIHARAAIAFHLNPESQEATKVGIKQMDGRFTFVSYPIDGGISYKEEKVIHNRNGFYELPRKDWEVGQGYQLLVQNPMTGAHIFVFSINSQDSINVFWPRNKNILGRFYYEKQKATPLPLVLGKVIEEDWKPEDFKLVIPSDNSVLSINLAGTDHICIFYGYNSILSEYKEILHRIETSKGTIVERVHKALGNRLISPSTVKYSANQMGFSTEITQGDIVPLILEIKSL